MSHELQAAFRAIARATEGLELPGADPAASLQLQRIVQTARQGHAVVRDLVTLSRIQVATLAWTSVDLADVVRRCAADLAPAAPGVAWQVGPLPAVAGDRSLLDLAVRQLLDNAVKFSRGTTAPRVEVEALADPQGWTIEVRDTGVGFDEASRHRLFQPLEHVHRRSDLQGSGVGLAMVRAAVERHGGRVAARLRPGGGAVFSFWLPASPPIESDDERAISAGAQDPDADLEWDDALLPLPLSASDPLRILLVDDDPLVRITLQAVLEHEGHAVVTLATAEPALAALRGATIPFDALLTDWSLPGMEGPQLALEARACHRSTRTILLTGQTTKMGLDIVPAGVDCVLAKPVRAAELRDALARGRPEERPEAAA